MTTYSERCLLFFRCHVNKLNRVGIFQPHLYFFYPNNLVDDAFQPQLKNPCGSLGMNELASNRLFLYAYLCTPLWK